MIKTVMVLNGPNLDRLGKRQPEIYGRETLKDLLAKLEEICGRSGIELVAVQSNHEGDLIDQVHLAADQDIPVIINAGGLTHTSVSLRDALAELPSGFIEVHISNIHAREEFRTVSLLSDIALGSIVGLGTYGYIAALEYLIHPEEK